MKKKSNLRKSKWTTKFHRPYPEFDESSRIQLLLGAEAFAELLSGGEPTVIPGNPTAVRTKFGYVITGRTESKAYKLEEAVTSLYVSASLRRFREIEEALQEASTDPTYILCEQHFKQTYERNFSGRFIVKLPFIPDAPPLGKAKPFLVKGV